MKPGDQVVALASKLRHRAHAFLRQELARRGLGQIQPAHGILLNALLQRGSLPLGRLADLVEKDKSTVSGLVDRLVAAGLVVKERDDSDRRVTRVRLTDESRGMVDELAVVGQAMRQRALRGLSPEERQALVDLLGRVIRNLGPDGKPSVRGK